MSNIPKLIGEIDFRDIKVKVYQDITKDNKTTVECVWQMRNPETSYTGIVYMKDGKLSYPEDAIIPEQTDRDREMLPKFLIIYQDTLTDEITNYITEYLIKEYKIRNTKK